MKYIIVTLFFFFFFNSQNSFSQNKRNTAHENIVMLKNGALFVRLKTSALKINALNKSGNAKEAEEVRLKQESDNICIINAFKENFKFCPVYFFYSNNSAEITSGNYKGLLINTDNKIDSIFTSNNYLIGEFDQSRTSQINAFFIKDKNYEQLKSPFPFLIKQNQAIVTERSNADVVSLLNKKLIAFYDN